MITEQIKRFERRCNELKDKSLTGSVSILVKYANGAPVHFAISTNNAPVSARPEIEDQPVGHILQSLWESLRSEDKNFFGDIKITKSFLFGRLMLLNESATIQCK